MEIQSKIEQKVVKLELLTINISLKDKEVIVGVLEALMKRSKPDRFEEYVIKRLVEAFTEPEIASVEPLEPRLPPEPIYMPDKPLEVLKELPLTINKEEIVNNLKKRIDTRNEKTLKEFIKESIEFAQKSVGIKTVPKSISIEDFYDWLVGTKIIFPDGMPNSSFGK